MSTITQRKKGWWKIWLLLGIIAVLFAVGIILYYVGYDYISWMGTGLVGAKMWGASAWFNGALESMVWVGIGMVLVYLYYGYLRGQQVKNVATGAVGGYNPIPTTPSQPNQGQETVIS